MTRKCIFGPCAGDKCGMFNLDEGKCSIVVISNEIVMIRRKMNGRE